MNLFFFKPSYVVYYILLIFSVLLVESVNATAQLENVRLQLRWHHQYQFAGYYAAQYKGYYEKAGFNVEIVAGSPEKQAINEVLFGRADFGVGNSEVLINRLQGKPIVGLAAMFQHSPSVLLTLASSGITKAEQLKNKTMMLIGQNNDAHLIAMLHAVGLSEEQINISKSTYNIDDLINEKTTAFSSYVTNEPFFLEERGISYNVISPRDYGIDFYSDILFTSEERVNNDPESVQRFKEASIKGWEYAIDHSEEIIQIIFEHYNQAKSLNHLRYEALSVNSMVSSELLPVGHVYPIRLDKMADVFIDQNMISDKRRLDKFMFVPEMDLDSKTLAWLISAALITLLVMITLIYFLKINFQLKKEIASRHEAEERLRILANTDSLTKLYNRRAFVEQYEVQSKVALRSQQVFCIILLDLDFFKNINDQYGHDFGDKVLIEAAKILTSTLRNVDVSARIGGEEFIVMLPKTPLEQAAQVAESIRQKFANTRIPCDEEAIHFTASFGVVQCDHSEFNDLLSEVDKALYRAKGNGRNRVEIVGLEA